jgi:exodeoxyribonuclease V gamma subunit
VPTRGVERWVAQSLSLRLAARPGGSDGICANVLFPFPGRVVDDVLAAATGVPRGEDPWGADRLVWPLLDVVDAHLGEPWLGALSAHLGAAGAGVHGGRRFSSVRHVADLFDRYAVHRPAMLRAWARGDESDGDGRPLPDDLRWQARLWRRLRERVGIASPAERLAEGCRLLGEDPGIVDLPARLSLFGLTRLPASYLDVLEALALGREVHLFLLHPSPALWSRIAPLAPGSETVRRAADPSAGAAASPLLASWGRDAREMQMVLGGRAGRDAHRPLAEEPDTLLGWLQADVRADRRPPGPPVGGAVDERRRLRPDDRSVEVHACHGRARQVEVVRDAILHALAEDPALEPRDVLVMCPSVEDFAPLVHATFAAAEDEDGEEGARTPDIRVRLADRSLRQTNPLLGVVALLLELASARLTAAQVLDLAAREPVRRRFELDDDDLARLERWAAESGVRWGLDAAHRAPYGLEDVGANTWRAGLDRLLAGVAMAEEDGRLVGGVLPLDDVEGDAAELAGRLAELVERLGVALDALGGPKPVAGWVATLRDAADALCAVPDRDAWQRDQLERMLDDVAAQAEGAPRPELSLAEVHALLADRLRGRPTRANFRTGHLTVCTLVPMRSVPHRMICVMGLDDGAFPRHGAPDGDDVLARDPRVGDRDVRGEDRQLLLDALMAATERLVIAYAGGDERTNAPLPPAVPVGELLDVVDATAVADGGPARERVVVQHPLQPFDGRNFTAGALGRPGPWSFDRAALAGARALDRAGTHRRPFLTEPLPPLGGEAVALALLERFVAHPVRAFLRERLGVIAEEAPEPGDEAIPIDPGHLEQWAIGTRLIDARLRGVSADAARAAEIARGSLPPGALGEPLLAKVEGAAGRVMDVAAAASCGGPARSLALEVPLGDGRVLSGTLGRIGDDLLWSVTFSRLGPRHRLEGWLRILALTAAEPERPWRSMTIGRPRSGGKGRAGVSIVPPLGRDPAERRATATEHLAVLVDLLDRGMREPLPLFTKTSAAYAEAARAGEEPVAAAEAVWEGGWSRPGEGADGPHDLVLGGAGLASILAEAPRPDEAGPGWDAREATRAGRLAVRLWSGLLDREQLEDL